jgi:hypothetical protein
LLELIWAAWLLLWLCPAQADSPGVDGQHCRGPAYAGRFQDDGSRWVWPNGTPSVVWRQSLGEGYSGLVASNGRVYSAIQTLSGQFLVCLDLKTGRELWRTRCNWPWRPDSDLPGPYGTPTVSAGKLYFADCFGCLHCVKAQNGSLVWSANLPKIFGVDPPAFGYAMTPLVFADKVIVPLGGKGCAVVALNADTGAIKWHSGDDPANYSSCILVQVGGKPQVLCCLENSAVGLDPASGLQLWRYVWPEQNGLDGSWPLYEEPFLFFALPFKHGARVLRIEDGAPASPVWSGSVISMDMLSGVASDGFVYAFDVRDSETSMDVQHATRGLFKCIELATGQECWSSPQPGQGSVLECGHRLLVLNEAGVLVAAEASPVSYRELGRMELFPRQTCWTAPTLSGHWLLARSHRDFVCVDLSTAADPGAKATVLPVPPRHGLLQRWLVRHHRVDFLFPGWQTQWRWFCSCLAAVLVPSTALALLAQGRTRRRRVFYFTAFLLSLLGTWALTEALGAFTYTWPVGVFLGLLLCLEIRSWARQSPGSMPRVIARLTLSVFVLLLLGYWRLCQSVFFPPGVTFLTGLLPAIPFAVWAVWLSHRRGPGWQGFGVAVLGFTVFFWSSALVFAWRITAVH